MIKRITIGSDPEFFIYKDGEVVSSIGIIEGGKDAPTEFEGGFAVHKDNVLLEMNLPPADTKEEFITNMKGAKDIASEILSIGGYKLGSNDSEEFSEAALSNWEAKTFGCAPYINAWTLGFGNPTDLADLMHRVAGTHIHIGYTLEDSKFDKSTMDILITRAFDFFVVYPSRQIYNDPIRSKYYGDYGNFRNKEYGVECRSLGGYFSKDKYLGWIYDQTIKALTYCSSDSNCELLKNVSTPSISPNKSYKLLNINLKEQLYDNDHTPDTSIVNAIKQEA
jgi:hypothetical protein